MVYFPEEVVEHILGFLSSHRDRNAVSLVCQEWYRVECLSRRSVLVCNCYAVCPECVHVRFPGLRSLSVKGRPRFVPAGWGATAEPWVDACVAVCPGLEELRLKRMVVTDECLKLLACSFPNFKSLVLVGCQGFSTDGLATVATNCRFIKELDLQESLVEDRGSRWLGCFPKPSTLLESLNFSCLTGILCRRPRLVDLCTGSSVQGNIAGAYAGLFNSFQHCSLLKSLSGFWDATSLFIPVIAPVCKNLTCLNLSSAPMVRSAYLIEFICQCKKLQQLWVLDHIGDEGLKIVASSCIQLQELRVFPANADASASTVTEEGLIAISAGCNKLQSVLYSCQRMTNSALITVAKNCPQFKSFRLCVLDPGSVDAVTGQPLDEGFGAIVQSCKDLKRLRLSGLLTDVVFLYIGMYAERLEMLSVAFAGDTDDGMTYVLNGCKNLKKLQIRDSPFGDSVLLAGMHQYEAMRSLWLSSCNVTLGGCKSLAASMANLNVEVMNGAASINEADNANDANKVEKLYIYRTVAGPRGDAREFISTI